MPANGAGPEGALAFGRTAPEGPTRPSAGRQLAQHRLNLGLEAAPGRDRAEPFEELAIDPGDLGEGPAFVTPKAHDRARWVPGRRAGVLSDIWFQRWGRPGSLPRDLGGGLATL